MNILSVNSLGKIGREEPLFSKITFGMEAGEKAAIIGRNGSGKSTLLGILAGNITNDEGSVVINKECGISYLAQNPAFNPENTIEQHIFQSKSPKLAKIHEYEQLCLSMEKKFSQSQQNYFDTLTLEMNKGDLWNYEAQVRSVLTTLGIKNMSEKMGTLSGGMLKKVALAQVLVEDTGLLLLDEPTNHLDIETIFWLQKHLQETKRAVLMVTHDRYFLDAVCSNIYELDRKKLKLYQGNYSTYLEKKQIELEIEENTERRIESVLRIERDWLMRGPCARGTKAKARIQKDNELMNREKFAKEKEFSFEVAGRRLGGKILELHEISKNYPKSGQKNSPENSTGTLIPVIKNFSYKFSKGEKIGIFGCNGSGKSTLLNIIAGKLQGEEGFVETGENTCIGYYQQYPEFNSLNLTVLDYIKEAAEVIHTNSGKDLSASQFLKEFGFEGKIQHSLLENLSGGERKRVFLIRLLISNPNFLILDEPTNDFDILTMNILEKFLSDYKGCLLIVSHDRFFMDKTADTLFIMEKDGSISHFPGKCSEYLQYLEEKKQEEAEKISAKKQIERMSAKQEKQPKKRRTFAEQKEFTQLEEEILELEERKPQLEQEMASTNYTIAGKAGKEYTELEKILAEKYKRWEELAELEE